MRHLPDLPERVFAPSESRGQAGWKCHTYPLEFYMSPQGADDGKVKPMATQRNDHNYPYDLVRIDMDTIMTLQARLREEQVRTG